MAYEHRVKIQDNRLFMLDLQRFDTSGLILFNTYNTSGTSVNLQEGTCYIKYGCSHPDQGSHSEVCDGFNTGRTSKQHNMNWEIYGRTYIVLCDISASRVYNLVYGSETVNKEMELDPTHYYSLVIDSYGGTTTVTCPTCGYGKSFSGSSSVYVQVYGTYEAHIRTQPKEVTLNCEEQAIYTVSSVNTANYQWQLYLNGSWISVSDGNIGTKGTSLSGTAGKKLAINDCHTDLDGLRVRCVITGLDYKQVITDDVLLNVHDNKGPTLKIKKSTENPTTNPVTITVEAEDLDSGLPTSAYSFDGGLTFSSKNTLTVSKNQDVNVVVTDLNGNITRETVTIDNIGFISSYRAYVGVNGKAARLKKMYIGYNGKAYPLVFKTDYIREPPIIPPTFAEATDEEIATLLTQHREGKVDLTQFWSVGDERPVHLSFMTGLNEYEGTHEEQDATLVILNGPNFFDLSDGGKNIFVIGLKETITGEGPINKSSTNVGGWKESLRRTWCDEVFMPALPETVQSWFKKFKYKASDGSQLDTSSEMENYFTLASRAELFGGTSEYTPDSEGTTQLAYYETAANRDKKRYDGTYGNGYWTRSPSLKHTTYFCWTSGSSIQVGGAASLHSISPFGCV